MGTWHFLPVSLLDWVAMVIVVLLAIRAFREFSTGNNRWVYAYAAVAILGIVIMMMPNPT